MASEPVVETEADLYQPFEAAAPEMTSVADGGVGSKAKLAFPTPDERPDEGADAWKWIEPLPAGSACEQFGPVQEKATPAMSPVIVVAKLCGSLALMLSVAPLLHQPLLPGTEQPTDPEIVGGWLVGTGVGSGSLQAGSQVVS